MNNFLIKLKTLVKLGPFSVLYIIWYRISIRTGIRRLFFSIEEFEIPISLMGGVARSRSLDTFNTQTTVDQANGLLTGEIEYYSYHRKQIGEPPNWFVNPFKTHDLLENDFHWTKIPDFQTEYGDIKNLWEASRFNWLITLARAFAVSSDRTYLEIGDKWLRDWLRNNPLNQGPNWKCGQEASIRVFNIINVTIIIDIHPDVNLSVSEVVYAHLRRISSNIRYALAQDNNHGTSEAAALFIGGSWLDSNYPNRYSNAKYFANKGRNWLENRIEKLVDDDGGFSQYSTNYHRVFLDTMIFAEYWRGELGLPSFSNLAYRKVRKAINWLFVFTDPNSGHTPNLGSNDGAQLLNMHNSDYRDFRPTLQTASVLFNQEALFPRGEYDEPLVWMNVKPKIHPQKSVSTKSQSFEGGYTYISGDDTWAMIRFPNFKFRPSHNDIFHFDLWYRGKNVVHDSGTYSYNPDGKDKNPNFKSVHFHNTVSFDGKEQMHELSRFLLGDWVKPDFVHGVAQAGNCQSWEGQYTNSNGFVHNRKIILEENIWHVEDKLQGDFEHAIIGFNISLGHGSINNGVVKGGDINIRLPKNASHKIVETSCSHYYMERHLTQRIETTVRSPGIYRTSFELLK